jgi:hypothetical protein
VAPDPLRLESRAGELTGETRRHGSRCGRRPARLVEREGWRHCGDDDLRRRR